MSPRGPAPARLIQPFKCTSSPGRYIWRSSKTYQRKPPPVWRGCQPSSLQRYSLAGRMAKSLPSRPTRSEGELSSEICSDSSRNVARPVESVAAVVSPGRSESSTPFSDAPSTREFAHAIIWLPSAHASRPIRVDCTHVTILGRRPPRDVRREARLDWGSTMRRTCPRPSCSASLRSMATSVISSGLAPVLTVLENACWPGGATRSSRAYSCR